jgi:hypothetical protein
MGVAVVASGQALEGLEVTAGGDVLRADTAAQWTAQLRRLLADKNARTSLAHAARKCVETRYSWPSRLAPLVGLAEALMERKSIDPARLSPIEAASAGSLRGIPSVNVAFPAPATLST